MATKKNIGLCLGSLIDQYYLRKLYELSRRDRIAIVA